MNFGFRGVSAKAVLVDYARNLSVTSNVSYTTIGNITDGSELTSGNSLSAGVPQYVQVDLGSPKKVKRFRILFTDAPHSSATGALQYSNDAVGWTNAITWVGLNRVLHIFDIVAPRARYWRYNTTATANPGVTGIDIYTWSLFG